MTITLGHAARLWFESGERLTGKMIREISSSISSNLLDRVKSLGKKKSRRKKFQQSVQEAVQGFLRKKIPESRELPLPHTLHRINRSSAARFDGRRCSLTLPNPRELQMQPERVGVMSCC